MEIPTLVQAPPRAIDEMHVTLVHTANDSGVQVSGRRTILRGADGAELAQPVEQVLDLLTALAAIHAALGHVLQGMMRASAAQASPEPPSSRLVIPGGHG